MNVDTDQQYEETKVSKVEGDASGWTVLRDDGWSLYVPSDACQIAPQPGEVMRCYGRGIGHTVRGIVINGRVYRYRTEAQDRQDHADMVARQKQERRDAYEAKREDFDRRVLALPEMLRLRVKRFRAIGENAWRHDHEPYELFCCEQAVVISEAVLTVEELQAFAGLPWEAQKRRVPKLDEGHSGNTFGASCALARALLERPDLLPKMHGALCPLVGCEAYGCFAAHEARRGIEA